jgi:hypothetical protein
MVAAAVPVAASKVVVELLHVSFAMFHIKKMQLINK